jgi:hypothetical protein
MPKTGVKVTCHIIVPTESMWILARPSEALPERDPRHVLHDAFLTAELGKDSFHAKATAMGTRCTNQQRPITSSEITLSGAKSAIYLTTTGPP